MRHKGAPHLQQEYGADLRWFQFYLLDVMAFCAAVALTAVFVAYKLLLAGCSRCRSRTRKKAIVAISIVFAVAISIAVKQFYS